MNKVVKIMLLTLLANAALFAVWLIPAYVSNDNDFFGWILIGFLAVGAACLVEMIMGIVFIAGLTKKQVGQGMLLGIGVTVLIGLSVCGGMLVFSS
jgi:hypothetical protein